MNALRTDLQSRGVKFVQASVDRLKFEGRGIASAMVEGDEIVADQFVLAAGAWSGRLAAHLGIKLPLLSGRGYGFTIPTAQSWPTVPSILVEARVAVTPMLDGTRFVGALELGPPEPGVSKGRIAGMRKQIPDYYPSYDRHLEPGEPIWHGHRPCSPDGLPYIGRPRQMENLIVATGHAMMGMSLGPITGSLVGQIADGEPPSIPLDLLSPDRFN